MALESKGIRLDFLPPSDSIAAGKALKVTFHYPDVDHPIYGKATDLQGSIDLIVPHGSFPISNFYTMTASDQDQLLEDYVHRLRKLHEELDEAEMKVKFRDWLTICCLIYPTEPVTSRVFKSVSDIFAIIFNLDDLADDDEIMNELQMSSSAIYRRYDNWQRLFDMGHTSCYNVIASQFPILKVGLSHLVIAVDEIVEFMPGLRDRLRFANRCLFESSETVPLVTLDMHCARDDMLSEEALKIVRGINAGFQMPLEFIAAVQGVTVPSKVRGSLLFEIFINGYNLGAGLFNDIFGLNKDLAKGASKDNCILRQVVTGVSFKRAFYDTLKLLRDTTNDTKLAGKKLIETFREEKTLPEFIRIAEYIFDGQIYSYLLLFKLKGRYGSIDFKIVEQ